MFFSSVYSLVCLKVAYVPLSVDIDFVGGLEAVENILLKTKCSFWPTTIENMKKKTTNEYGIARGYTQENKIKYLRLF